MAREVSLFVLVPMLGPPDAGWVGVVDTIVSTPIHELWAESVAGLKTSEVWGLELRDGREHTTMEADPSLLAAAAEAARAGQLASFGVSRSAETGGPMSPVAHLHFGCPVDPETREWFPAWASVRGGVQLPEFDRGLSATWMACLRTFMTSAAQELGAVIGAAADPARHREAIPRWRLYEGRFYGRATDWHNGRLPGLAPLFVVDPDLLDTLGGIDALRTIAAAIDVVPHRDGRVGEVVQVGEDDADFLARIPATVAYMESCGVW